MWIVLREFSFVFQHSRVFEPVRPPKARRPRRVGSCGRARQEMALPLGPTRWRQWTTSHTKDHVG